jgi:glycosyltransferase involved in cell wall biosynthesis
MRIGLVSTLSTRVRPRGSGSVEGLVWLLSRELTRLGHAVTVFAAAKSEPVGELVAALAGPYGTDGAPHDWQLCEWLNLSRAVEVSGGLDVIHSHAYLWGLALEPLAKAPMVHTTHVLPDGDAAALRTMRPAACVTAVSAFQWAAFTALPPATVVHHGLDPEQFTFRRDSDDYVCFLGRFVPGKGPKAAVAAARDLGLRLLLAGPRNDYYRAKVEPLVDGRMVEYVGPVGGARRDQLLGGARALLYPLQGPESFGLVLVEAMMCGTPVAAVGIGAVPEIVDEGVTGATVATAEELSQAVKRAIALDRQRVRARAAERFSADHMARQYVEVYGRALGGN